MSKKTIEIKEGQSYRYEHIKKYARDNKLSIKEIGDPVIGENFIVLKDEKGLVTSFMLNGVTANDYIYKCIHTDIIF